MSIKKQFSKIKENWLLVSILVLALFVLPVFQSGVSNFGGMSQKALYMESYDMAPNMARSVAYYDDGEFAPDVKERIITKTSSISTEVERGEFFSSQETLKKIISENGVITLNEDVNVYGSEKKKTYSGSYELKVDTKKYETFVAALKGIGEVQSSGENMDDITGQYTNVQIELTAEKERLARFEAMYAEAVNVEDKIELNDRIFDQERTVKYLEDRIENMDNRVEYSTVYFRMQEKRSEYANVVFVKFSELVRTLVDSFNGLVTLLFGIIPWAIFLGLVYLGYRFFKN